MYVSFEEAINSYYEYLKLKDKNSTYVSNVYRFNKYILPYCGNNNIFTFSKKDYLNWQYYINSFDFKYNYKSVLHYCFVSFLNYCIVFYDLKYNVASIVGNFKNNDIKKTGYVWSIDDFNKFISVVDEPIYKTLFELLYFTGLRKGEALALTWEDIDFNNNKISITKTLCKEHIDGQFILSTPKTNSSIRMIGIDEYIIIKLLELKKYYILNFDSFDESYFVFGGNKPLAFTTLTRKKDYYCNLANVKRIKIHDFRHSHACLLFMNDVPIDEISHRLGHSTISMTTDTYLKYLPIKEKRVLETLNSLH